jgi:hypothetical protein
MKRSSATIAVLGSILFMANVVAAGCMRVLTDITIDFSGGDHYLVWLFIGATSIGAALAFIGGAIPAGLKFLRWIG